MDAPLRAQLRVSLSDGMLVLSAADAKSAVPLETVQEAIAERWTKLRRGPRRSEVSGSAPVVDHQTTAEACGAAFWRAALGNRAGEALLSAVDRRAPWQSLRIELRLDDHPAVHALPWELAAPPGRKALSLAEGVELVRAAGTRAARRADTRPPIRMAFVGVAPVDAEPGMRLDLEGHARTILRAMESLHDPSRLWRAPFGDETSIRHALERARPQVLFMAGHGQPGVVELEREVDGKRRLVPPEHLATLLGKSGDLRLAVLSQCSSAVDPAILFRENPFPNAAGSR